MYRYLLCIIAGFLLTLFAGCVTNPITGQSEFILIGESQDIEIGQTYGPEIEKQLGGRIEDEKLQDYVNGIGKKVAAVSHRPDYDYHFTAVNDKSINAMALPGGYIYITRGMLEKLKSEAELASVLGHETVHVVARHSAAAMSREMGISLLLSVAANQEMSQGALVAADLANQVLGLKYSRDDELEADMAGIDYMVAAGYNPKAMIDTMEMLDSEERIRPIEFFSTHPSPENRILYINQRIQSRYPNSSQLKLGEDDYSRNVLKPLEKIKKVDEPNEPK